MDTRLKIDYDAGRPRPSDAELAALLARAGYSIVRRVEYVSGGGEGRHLILSLDPEPATPMEIVALQAVCGSDPFREACNVQRARRLPDVDPFFRERWNVLYTGKPGGAVVAGAPAPGRP